MSLFFGCRERSLDLYADEKQGLVEKGILQKVFLALSRDKSTPKVMYLLFRLQQYAIPTDFFKIHFGHFNKNNSQICMSSFFLSFVNPGNSSQNLGLLLWNGMVWDEIGNTNVCKNW